MQLLKMCNKKNMVQYVWAKSEQWYPLTAFFFFRMPLRSEISVAKHMELIILKRLNRYMALIVLK